MTINQMSAVEDQILRKTISLPERLWKEIGNYRFHRRFPTETGAVADVISRGLRAGSIFNAVVDVAMDRATLGSGQFSQAATKTFGDAPTVEMLVVAEVRRWSLARGLSLKETEIKEKARLVYCAAEKLAAGGASHGQAGILDVAVEWLIEWAFLH